MVDGMRCQKLWKGLWWEGRSIVREETLGFAKLWKEVLQVVNDTVCGLGMDFVNEWVLTKRVGYEKVIFTFVCEVVSS